MNAKRSTRAAAAAAVLLALALALSGCGGGGSSTKRTATDAQGCEQVSKPRVKPVNVSKPTKQLDASKQYTAVFNTNCGSFSVLLDVKNNPITASSFANLVTHKVYDGTWFHRIIAGFVVQGGDPQGTGMGDAGYSVVEKPTGKYEVGTVAMAKSGAEPAGTSSAQFYIVIGAQGTQLPPDYAIAGKVSSGTDVVDKIAAHAGTDQAGTPTGVTLITTATLNAKG